MSPNLLIWNSVNKFNIKWLTIILWRIQSTKPTTNLFRGFSTWLATSLLKNSKEPTWEQPTSSICSKSYKRLPNCSPAQHAPTVSKPTSSLNSSSYSNPISSSPATPQDSTCTSSYQTAPSKRSSSFTRNPRPLAYCSPTPSAIPISSFQSMVSKDSGTSCLSSIVSCKGFCRSTNWEIGCCLVFINASKKK